MAEHRVGVRQLYTCYREDLEAAPAGFESAGLLERSVLDVAEFAEPRRLPLLCDILDLMYAATDGTDYLIYTNVDIALMPSFYLTAARLIDEGFDAFVINPRMISDRYTDPADLSLMYAQVGKPRKGWDCFVFPRSAYPSYRMGRVCLGAPYIGRTLLLNLVAFADHFEEFKDFHATFHIGNAGAWKDPRFADLKQFNRVECTELERQFGSLDKDLTRYHQTTRKPFENGMPGPRRRFSSIVNASVKRARRAWRR
jgi:hypothetical protein